jgi:Ca2+-binding EF-hand superfamily protein
MQKLMTLEHVDFPLFLQIWVKKLTNYFVLLQMVCFCWIKFSKGLSEVRKQELTKAFSVFDRDGSGSITKEELALVLQNLHPNMKPSLEEVNQIMNIMDQNGDGVIELSEFLSTMQNWLEEESEGTKDTTNSKKRPRESMDVNSLIQPKKSVKRRTPLKSFKIFSSIFNIFKI